MALAIGLLVLALFASVVSARAAWNAWTEDVHAGRIRRERQAKFDGPVDPLMLLDGADELDELVVQGRHGRVRFSRLTGWKVDDPRGESCGVPAHLYPIYANRFREAADIAAVVFDVILLLTGAALGMTLADFLTGLPTPSVSEYVSLYVSMALTLVAVIAGFFRLQIVREWTLVSARFRVLALPVVGERETATSELAATIAQAVQDGIAAARPRRWWHRS